MDTEMVTVQIMGKTHKVPADVTIMGALEYAGYQIKRGAGCRAGFCGACATVYRMPGDYKIRVGMACATVVQDGMFLSMLPCVPAQKPVYDITKLEPSVTSFQMIYPEAFRCVACNTCTKACPQDLEVMDYVQAVIRGDIAKAADLSFDCISCNLCAIRCPAEMVQASIGLLARRLYGRYLNPKSRYLEIRLKEIASGKYDEPLARLMSTPIKEIEEQYYARDIESEPQAAA